MNYKNRKYQKVVRLNKGIVNKNNNDPVEDKEQKGLSVEDFGIELTDNPNFQPTIVEMTEEEKKEQEAERARLLREEILAEEEERARRIKEQQEPEVEEPLEENALQKILGKFKGKKSKEQDSVPNKVDIVEIDPEVLAKKGYPKQLIDPTDIEMDKDGNPQYFFNIKKTLAKNNMEWLMKILGEDRLVALTYDDDFLDKYADKQHKKAYNYNSMSATEQYLYDRKKKRKKLIVILLILTISIGGFVFKRGPEKKMKEAKNMYVAGQYEESFKAFKEISGDDAKAYSLLSFIKLSIKDKKFDDARKASEELRKMDVDILDDETENFLNEISYIEAMDHYKDKDYIGAANIFKEMLGYKESKEYYNKSMYSISEKFFDDGKTKEALEGFYNIKDYSDAEERYEKIALSEYNKAINLYNKKEYDKAQDIFKMLSTFSYKDSTSIIGQCTYKKGLDFYKDKKYDEAIKTLSKNKDYKDSRTLINESIYMKANSLLVSSPAKANIEFSKIRGYRDVNDIMKLPLMNLYGEWTIYKANDQRVENENFVFSANRKILSTKPIKDLRVSSPGDEVSYNWEGDMFITEDGLSSIKVIGVSDNEIEILATDQKDSTTYTCRRANTLYEVLDLDKDKDKNNNEDDDNANEIDDDFIDSLLDKYVN